MNAAAASFLVSYGPLDESKSAESVPDPATDDISDTHSDARLRPLKQRKKTGPCHEPLVELQRVSNACDSTSVRVRQLHPSRLCTRIAASSYLSPPCTHSSPIRPEDCPSFLSSATDVPNAQRRTDLLVQAQIAITNQRILAALVYQPCSCCIQKPLEDFKPIDHRVAKARRRLHCRGRQSR